MSDCTQQVSAKSGRWSADDDSLLRGMYPTHSAPEIASALNRDPKAVRSRCWYLGLNEKQKPWTDDQIQELVAAYQSEDNSSLNLEELSARLGRPKTSVSRKARELGLSDAKRRKTQPRPARPSKTKDELRELQSKITRDRIAKNGHPRGFLGGKHSQQTKAVISTKARRAWGDPASGLNSEATRQKRSDNMFARMRSGSMLTGEQMYSRAKRGKRADIGNRFFRSRWEANYARYLNFLQANGKISSWDYECQEFWFTAIKRGTRSYKPDFKVVNLDGSHEWHEVKGWMDPKSKTRLDRMKRYYPEEKIVVIGESWFRAAKKQGLPQIIAGWETDGAKAH